MKKSLASKVVPYVFAGLGLIGSGCAKTYEIDESKVTDYRRSVSWFEGAIMEEKKDSCIIKYFTTSKKVKKIKVKSSIYLFTPLNNRYKLSHPKDSAVMRFGTERFNYLTNKVDSIKEAYRQQKIAFKEAKKQKRINYGLRAFGK